MKWFRWLCWIPVAMWVAMRQYIHLYDGWGRWAAAPLLLVPVAVSALLVGLALLHTTRETGARASGGDWIAMGIAALPMLWIALRLLIA